MEFKAGRLGTAVAAAVAGVLVAGALTVPAIAVPTPSPTPDPARPTTAAQAADQVKQLEDQASEIGEDYDAAMDALAAGNARLKTLQADIALQQQKVDAISAQAQAIALAQFRGRDMDTTVQIFTSGDPETVMARLSTASKVDADMDTVLAEQQAEQANLTDMQRAAAAEVAALSDQEQKSAELKKQIDAKVNAAQDLFNTLTLTEQEAEDGGDNATPDPGDYANASERIQAVVKYALSRVGNSQYVWGASGPHSFDCSGLMLASYRSAGISLPHSSRTLSTMGKAVDKSDLQPGDLVFFYHPVHHVGMYIGGGKFVHARNTRVDLVVQTLASYPAPWAGARRILN